MSEIIISNTQQYKYDIINQYNKNELLEQKQPQLQYTANENQENQEHTILNLHNGSNEIINNNNTNLQNKWWFLNFNIITRLFQN
jgi:hypothetical protein